MFLKYIGQLFIFSLNNGNGNCKKAMLMVIIKNNMSFAPIVQTVQDRGRHL